MIGGKKEVVNENLKMNQNNLYKKKILLLTEAFDEGGTEIAMLSLINCLKKFECKMEILCISKAGVLLNTFPKDVSIREITFSNKFWKKLALKIEPQWHRLDMLPYNLFWKWQKKKYPIKEKDNKLYKHMLQKTLPQKGKWDIVFDFYGYGSFLTAYATESIEARVKATWVHATAIHSWNKVEEYLWKFEKIYCVSNSVLKSFNQKFPELNEKTEVLFNLTDTNRIITKSKEKVEDIRVNEKFIFLTVGRLENVKRIDFAIRVAKKLKERNINFIWYVIGDGTLKEMLQKLIKSEDIEDCFILLGRRTNVYPYLLQCDLYIQPSKSEGYSTTILEARVLKRIIIATDIDSNREQIITGETGYLVKDREEEFVETIQKIIGDRNLQEKIVENLKKEEISFMGEINKFKSLL